MPSIRLQLPQEVLEELELSYEGTRDVPTITLAIQGVSFVANAVTILAIRPHIADLVAAVRNWRLRYPQEKVVLTARGPGIDLRIELPPNVSRATLLQQMQPLLDEDDQK